MRSILPTLSLTGLIPVINIPNPSCSVDLVDALYAGGLPLIELTLRNETSLESLALIKKERPNMFVAAGTVLTIELAEQAIDCGADLIVTPGFNPKVVEYCLKQGVSILPGCITPTEIEAGLEYGLTMFKFFPAEHSGGVKFIKELCGPYKNCSFVATSGINIVNLPDYMSCTGVSAVGGSFMAPADQISEGKWEQIVKNCKHAVAISHSFELLHVGVAQTNQKQCPLTLNSLFGDGISIFRPSELSNNSKNYIEIGVNSVDRAVHYLTSRGVTVGEHGAESDSEGRLSCVFLEGDFGGFAVCLRNKL